MRYYDRIKPVRTATSVALGLFDGVHRGHQSVISQAVAQKGLLPVVLSFTTKHEIPANKQNFSKLITDTVKQDLLRKLGVRILMEPDFSDIRDLTAQAFVQEVLAQRLRARTVVCGYDYRFGRGAEGNPQLLRELAEPLGIQVIQLPAQMEGGEPISSTRIRAAIAQGEIGLANRLLGYDYCFDFPVTNGAQLGRTIDCPTINQLFHSEFLIPRFGVYASRIPLGRNTYYGVTNVGVKPTVHNTSFPLAETHIIGFQGDLYGKQVKVHLLEYLRPERKFSGIRELKEAIQENIQYVAREYSQQL